MGKKEPGAVLHCRVKEIVTQRNKSFNAQNVKCILLSHPLAAISEMPSLFWSGALHLHRLHELSYWLQLELNEFR